MLVDPKVLEIDNPIKRISYLHNVKETRGAYLNTMKEINLNKMNNQAITKYLNLHLYKMK